jgi:hypothetical protein
MLTITIMMYITPLHSVVIDVGVHDTLYSNLNLYSITTAHLWEVSYGALINSVGFQIFSTPHYKRIIFFCSHKDRFILRSPQCHSNSIATTQSHASSVLLIKCMPFSWSHAPNNPSVLSCNTS